MTKQHTGSGTIKRMRWYLPALLHLLFLAGCATPSLEGRVTRFHVLDAAPKSFVIVPTDDQHNSLEFRTYAELVRDQLATRGWREAPFAAADVALFLQYRISQGREVTFSYPILGRVPTGRSTTTGTLTSYGNHSTLDATTTQQTTLGVVGSGVGSRTLFDRGVRITMFSASEYRASNKMERLYEGEIRSTGIAGDLPTVMPALLEGLFRDFPGNSGSAITVVVPVETLKK